jgi:type IV conjugative transfer system coupling protein TraD
MKLSESFTHGGQTQLHKFHMIRQVLGATFKVSLVIGVLMLTILIYRGCVWQQFYALFLYYAACLRESFSFLPYGFLDRVDFPFVDGFRNVRCAWLVRDPSIDHFVIRLQGALLEKVFYALLGMMVSFVGLSWFWIARGYSRQKKKILQGTLLVKPSELKRLIKKKDRSDLILGGVPLLKNRETEHMMIVGTTGTGKSNCLNHLLQQIRDRGDRAVIVDTTGSLVSKFFREGKDKLLNPLDERSSQWNLWGECKEPYHYVELAQGLIPETGADPIWWTSARKLFAVTAQLLKQKNQTSIQKLLEYSLISPIAKVAEFYQETQVASFMNATADKTALSVRSTLGMVMEAFAYLKSDKKPFSIRDWVQKAQEEEQEEEERKGKKKDKDWLFLSSSTEQRELLAPLLSTWLSIAYKALMGLDESYTRRLWFIIDELPSLNVLPNLPKALAETRKYGGCFVIGLQNLPQLEQMYGVNLTRSIAGLCGTKVVFRTSDAPTAKKLSEFFGEQEISEAAESISFGAHQMRDGVNLAEHRRIQPTIPYTDLLCLDNLQAYLQLSGPYPMTKLTFKYLLMLKKTLGYIPREITESEERMKTFINDLTQSRDSVPSSESAQAAPVTGTDPEVEPAIFQKEKDQELKASDLESSL